ncbi:MAG: putative thioredoxin [Bradymonadia bacterium]|jgi:putative thioredoxin
MRLLRLWLQARARVSSVHPINHFEPVWSNPMQSPLTPAQPNPYVFDVSEVPDFQERVMKASMETPVLVDFWAPWCQPCKTLTPALEKVVAEYGGRVLLAKVNVDQAQQLAQAFRVQSVPSVFLFDQGQPVDAFQGARSEKEIKEFISALVPPPVADPIDTARAAYAAGDMIAAELAFTDVLATEPRHGEALLSLARIALSRGAPDTASGWLDQIPAEDPVYAQAQRMRGVFAFAEHAGDLATLEAAVEADADDVESWYTLGATRATQGDPEGACKAFIKVVMLDREYREDGGRAALLAIFDMLGSDDPLVAKYRRRLASVMF